MTRDEIIKKVRDAGIIGEGGGGFPAYMKLGANAEFVLANGAECEPLLSNDKVALERFSDEVVGGLQLVMQCVGAKKGYLCVKAKYKRALEAVKKALSGKENIEMFLLEDFYPVGDEMVLVKEVLGRTVPAGGLPLDVGTVINNVSSLMKIYNVVEKNESVTRKLVSINGEVKEPKVATVPIGMKISEVIAIAGGATIEDYAVIIGGPNMGALADLDTAVIKKTTGGIIVLPTNHPLVAQQKQNIAMITKRSKAACLNCSFCSNMCPRNLIGHNIQPHKIMRAINLELDTQAEALTAAFLCSGCGVCENYACYMFLSPRKVCQKVKFELMKRGVKNPYKDKKNEQTNSLSYERKIPLSRLKAKLGLTKYSDNLPFDEKTYTANEVNIMLNQHIGAVSIPAVKEGDAVKIGDVIAEMPKGAMGVVYHSSIDGKVAKITQESILIKGRNNG